MIIRVLLNTDPMRMLPPEAGGGAHAGDVFTERAFEFTPDRFRAALREQGLPADFREPNEQDVCDLLWKIGNEDVWRGRVWPADERSLSIGDVVIVGENAYSCVSLGWQLLDADMVRSFTIREG